MLSLKCRVRCYLQRATHPVMTGYILYQANQCLVSLVDEGSLLNIWYPLLPQGHLLGLQFMSNWVLSIAKNITVASHERQIIEIRLFSTVSLWSTVFESLNLKLYHWHAYWIRLPPIVAYMRHCIGSPLVQITACRLFGYRPSSKPMLGYCQLGHKEQTSVKL